MKNRFTMDQVREFWNSVADRYDQQATDRVGLAHKRRFMDAVRFFHPRPGDSVLNVWSRTGNLLPYLRQHRADLNIVNLELAERLVMMAIAKYPRETFLQSSLDTFPFEDGAFDWVISLEALEHCPWPPDFLDEIHRVLTDDGTVILSCPPATAEPLATLAHALFHFHGEGPHKFPSSRKVKAMIDAAGFELLHHEGTVLLPCGPDWAQRTAAKVEPFMQWLAPVREMCIRQFYVFRKKGT